MPSMAAALSSAQGCAPPAGVAGGARDGGACGVAGVGDRAVSLVFAGWLPQSACFVAGGRVLRSGVAGLAAGLGDRAAAGRLAGLLEAGDEAEPGGELGGAEALPVDDLELERERGQRVDAAEAAQASDGRPELGSLRDAGEPLVEVCAAGEQAVDVRDQLGEHERRVGLVELLRADPGAVVARPG